MDNGGGDGTGCFGIKIGANTVKFTNIRIAGFGKSRHLVRESDMFVEDETEIASRVGSDERAVFFILASYCLSPMMRNSVFRRS